MNDLMSMGIHRVWKRYFVATAQVGKGDRVLDLAGGTGDIAALLRDRVGESGELVLGDINGEMLRVGRDRMTDRGNVRGFEYVQCNAQALPFPDASFRSEEHTSELQSLMRISYAVFCLKKKNKTATITTILTITNHVRS